MNRWNEKDATAMVDCCKCPDAYGIVPTNHVDTCPNCDAPHCGDCSIQYLTSEAYTYNIMPGSRSSRPNPITNPSSNPRRPAYGADQPGAYPLRSSLRQSRGQTDTVVVIESDGHTTKYAASERGVTGVLPNKRVNFAGFPSSEGPEWAPDEHGVMRMLPKRQNTQAGPSTRRLEAPTGPSRSEERRRDYKEGNWGGWMGPEGVAEVGNGSEVWYEDEW